MTQSKASMIIVSNVVRKPVRDIFRGEPRLGAGSHRHYHWERDRSFGSRRGWRFRSGSRCGARHHLRDAKPIPTASSIFSACRLAPTK